MVFRKPQLVKCIVYKLDHTCANAVVLGTVYLSVDKLYLQDPCTTDKSTGKN